MAATTTRSATRRASAAKAAEPETVEVDEEDFEDMEVEETEDDDDLEELEDGDEVEEDEAPAKTTKKTAAKKASAPKQPVIAFGSKELAAHVTETTGETYDARAVRMLLRKLAKDEKFQRVVGEDRSRYSFSGPEDPAVKLVIEMVKSGAAKELKQAGLQAVKDKAAAKKAEKAAAKAKAAEVEDDEEEMEEVEEAPAPKRRTATTKTAAPAKATPARRTARAAK